MVPDQGHVEKKLELSRCQIANFYLRINICNFFYKYEQTFVNPLDPETAAAGRSVQSWNGRRPHTRHSIKKILAINY